jgi:hypothetical protein
VPRVGTAFSFGTGTNGGNRVLFSKYLSTHVVLSASEQAMAAGA